MLPRIILTLLAALAGCAHHPTITYPELPEVGEREAALDCAAMDRSILKTDTIRWVMREDGAHLLTQAEIAGRTITSLAVTVGTWFPLTLPYDGHYALSHADDRLLGLLELKRDKGCRPLPSGVPGMTDLDVLEALLRVIEGHPVAGQVRASEHERLEERTRLLDRLQPLPTQSLP